MKIEYYDKYYQQGGSYVIPVEIFNELFEDYECFKNDCKKYKEVIDKAIDKLYCWGEALDPNFQKIMLDILKGVNND